MSLLRGFDVLTVDDDQDFGSQLIESLALRQIRAVYAETAESARNAVRLDDNIGVLLVDQHLGGLLGTELILSIKEEHGEDVVCIILSGDETQASAIDAIRVHAFDYLLKSSGGRAIADTVRRAQQYLKNRQVQLGDRVVSSRDLAQKEPRRSEEENGTFLESMRQQARTKRVKFDVRVAPNFPASIANREVLSSVVGRFSLELLRLIPDGSHFAMSTSHADRHVLLSYRISDSVIDINLRNLFVHVNPKSFRDLDRADPFSLRLMTEWIYIQMHGGSVETIIEDQNARIDVFLPIKSPLVKPLWSQLPDLEPITQHTV